MDKKLISLGVLLFGLYLSGNAANLALVPQTGQTSTLPLAAPTNSDGDLRKGAAWPSTRFVADPSGNCITDNLTGLMWVKDLDTVNGGNYIDWYNALTTADNGTWCGYTDWRMPNINELRSLANYGYASPANWLMYGSGSLGSPACSGVCFANVKTNYWTSSSSASNPASAWNFTISNGNTGTNPKTSGNTVQLFPVRGGQ
jgi:hypothetical protein